MKIHVIAVMHDPPVFAVAATGHIHNSSGVSVHLEGAAREKMIFVRV
jgi:hypothetical protein